MTRIAEGMNEVINPRTVRARDRNRTATYEFRARDSRRSFFSPGILSLAPSCKICIVRVSDRWGFFFSLIEERNYNDPREIAFSRESRAWGKLNARECSVRGDMGIRVVRDARAVV